MWVAVQAPPREERDRVDHARVGQLVPGRLREIQRLDARELFALALRRPRAARFDLLVGHPFELAVVVENAHVHAPF